VDGAGKVVMPGFANIHTHFTLIIAKGIYEDLSPPHKPPFTSGLAPLPVPQLSNDEMNAMVRLAALEAIRSGTTAALEDGSNVESYAQTIVDTGCGSCCAKKPGTRRRAISVIRDPLMLTRRSARIASARSISAVLQMRNGETASTCGAHGSLGARHP